MLHLEGTALRQVQAFLLERKCLAEQIGIGFMATPEAIAGFGQGGAIGDAPIQILQRCQPLHLGHPTLAAVAFGCQLQSIKRVRALRARRQQRRVGFQCATSVVRAGPLSGPESLKRRARVQLAQLFA